MSYLDSLNIQLYKLDSINNQNNLIFYDKNKNYIIRETNLLNVFDIVKSYDPKKFLFSAWDSVKTEKSFIQNKHELNKLDDETIKLCLMNEQKPLFKWFRLQVELNVKHVQGFTSEPSFNKIITKNNLDYFNMFTPKHNFKDIQPTNKREFPCIEKLLKNILREGYEHFIHFLAWKVQKPSEMIPCHWIIQDDGGTGKTEILGDFILNKIFNISIIGQDELQSAFSSYIQDSEIIICEEIEGFENEKKIKHLTGSKTILINEKFKTGFKIRNFNNWIVFSNDINALKISEKDRRFNVVGGGLRLSAINNNWDETLFKSESENKAFFSKFHKDISKEIKSLYSYLLGYPIDRLQLQQPLITQHKKDLQELNQTSEIQFIKEIHETNLNTIIEENYTKSKDRFFNEGIIKKDNTYWIKTLYLYDLYKDYTKINGLRQISKNHFIRRLKETKEYNLIFSDYKTIWDQNKTFKALELKTYKDDNKDIT